MVKGIPWYVWGALAGLGVGLVALISKPSGGGGFDANLDAGSQVNAAILSEIDRAYVEQQRALDTIRQTLEKQNELLRGVTANNFANMWQLPDIGQANVSPLIHEWANNIGSVAGSDTFSRN